MFEKASILSWMLLLPALGALALLALPKPAAKYARPIALLICIATLLMASLAASWINWNATSYPGGESLVQVQLATRTDWMSTIGAQYFVGVDGISMPLLLLATAITTLACWASYRISSLPKSYFALLLFLLSTLIGLFISLDLLLFYLFLTLSTVPLYFLIGQWGGPRREYAALKFFIYMLLSSTILLIPIIGLYHHTKGMGEPLFDLLKLATDPLIRSDFSYGGHGFHFAQIAFWLFVAGFAVRIPIIPFHTWLIDTQVAASTPASMLITALTLNAGAYGLLRVAFPIFPVQAADASFYLSLLALATILYGVLVALAQKDFKRLIAAASISQMGYILLGIAVISPLATSGALFQMIASGISFAMLYFVAGILEDRTNHREIVRLGGIWAQMPAYTGWAMIAFLAAAALPGLSGFVGQLMILLGTFSAADANSFINHHTGGMAFTPLLWFGVLATGALILNAALFLWTFQRIYMGAPKPEHHNFPSLSSSEKWILVIFALAALTFGIAPALLLNNIRPAIEGLMRLITA